MSRRTSVSRSLRTGALTAALSGLVLALLPGAAHASPLAGPPWDASTYGNSYSSPEYLTVNIDQAPLHSFIKASLVDCSGKTVRTTYGRTWSYKRDGQPWVTHAQAHLNVPPTGGPYSHWAVAIAVKGKPTERHRVVGNGAPGTLRLGCAPGEYHRPTAMRWDSFEREVVRRPVNAKFSLTQTQLVKTYFRFGKPSGTVRAGKEITFGRSGLMVKKAGTKKRVLTKKRLGCQHELEFTAPGDVSDSRGIATEPCWTRRALVPRKEDGRATAGSRLVSHTEVWKDQHQYVRVRDLGIVKKARKR